VPSTAHPVSQRSKIHICSQTVRNLITSPSDITQCEVTASDSPTCSEPTCFHTIAGLPMFDVQQRRLFSASFKDQAVVKTRREVWNRQKSYAVSAPLRFSVSRTLIHSHPTKEFIFVEGTPRMTERCGKADKSRPVNPKTSKNEHIE